MVTETIEKQAIRNAISEFSKTDPEFLAILLEDIKIQMAENRRKQIENVINEDFVEYESVFKALA